MADIVRIHAEQSPERDPLWREILGRCLRSARVRRDARLVDVAAEAGISPQYLSEIERGRKEPSSEIIAAVTAALGIRLDDLLAGIIRQRGRHDLARPPSRPAGPVLMAAAA